MKKLATSVLLVLVMLAMTVGTALAQEAVLITGTVQNVVIEVNETTGETVVVVSLLDEANTPQTVQISLETAETLGLVLTDPDTGETVPSESAVGTNVEIDPTVVIPEDNAEEALHPVGSALSEFFSDVTGVDYETVMAYHEEGMGFGVLAQALWLSNSMGGGEEMFTALLDAKQSGDYSGITLADGSTPGNWGEVVKSLRKGENLGSVRSGHAENNQGNDKNPEKQTLKAKNDKNDKSNNGNANNNNGNSHNGDNNGNNGNGGNNGNSGNGGNNGNGNGNGNGH